MTRVPALHELVIVNETSSPISELTIHLVSEPPFVKPRIWSLESVGVVDVFESLFEHALNLVILGTSPDSPKITRKCNVRTV